MPYCVFRKCKNYTGPNVKSKKDVSFHLFPKDKLLRRKWTQIVTAQRREDDWMPTTFSTICSQHFKESDKYVTKKNFRKLIKTAIPVVEEVIPLPCTSAEISDVGLLDFSEPSPASDINMTPSYDDEPKSEEELQIDLNTIAAVKKRRRPLWEQPGVAPPTTASTSETNVDGDDPDLQFFISLIPLMKNLPITNKLRIRNLIQTLIYKELESVEQNKAIDSISNKIICTNDERGTKLDDPSDEDSNEHYSVNVKDEVLEFTEEEVLYAIKTENEEQALMN